MITHANGLSHIKRIVVKCALSTDRSLEVVLSVVVFLMGRFQGHYYFLYKGMYADDTHLTCAGDNADNIQLHLNQDLEIVHNWLRPNKLTLNMTKTEFMLLADLDRG